MKAAVSRDITVRTITIKIVQGSVPDLDVTQSWHRKPRIIRPDQVVLTLVWGQISQVAVSGGLVLKSGSASDLARDNMLWYSPADMPWYSPADLAKVPDWVRVLVEEAPQGTIVWAQEEAQQL